MKDRIRAKNNCSGFTMVEMVVVIAIIAILASAAVPAFGVWLPNSRLKSEARNVYSSMQFAKLTAVKDNADVVIWFDKNNDTYRIFLDNGDGIGGTAGDGTQNGDEKTLRDVTLPDDVDLYNYVFSVLVNQTSFNSRGFAQGGWGYVYLKNDHDRYMRITLWTTGNLKIEKSTDGTNWSE